MNWHTIVAAIIVTGKSTDDIPITEQDEEDG
jgi:hypothetical protein